jgi:hypothetical protein
VEYVFDNVYEKFRRAQSTAVNEEQLTAALTMIYEFNDKICLFEVKSAGNEILWSALK